MNEAIEMAKIAYKNDDVPVGAVIVKNGEIISSGYNMREKNKDATAHAEIIAIRNACEKLNSWHLDNCEIYVTLEPCPMCMGAIVNSRMKKIIFGAKDAKAGACGSLLNFNSYPLNHKPLVDSCVMEDETRKLLSDFFSEKRKQKK